MTKLFIRVDFSAAHAMGPGMASLLDRIQAEGSIRAAATSMNMSYRKAWLLIQTMQEIFGDDVVTTSTGGTAGGGAALTPLGRKLLALYRRIERRAARAAASDLQRLSSFCSSAGGQNIIRPRRSKLSAR